MTAGIKAQHTLNTIMFLSLVGMWSLMGSPVIPTHVLCFKKAPNREEYLI